jgi:hypothetical protein
MQNNILTKNSLRNVKGADYTFMQSAPSIISILISFETF